MTKKLDWSKAEVQKISPTTKSILGMIANEHVNLQIAMAELVANSLDQLATNIEISYDEKRGEVSVKDDGNGCPITTREMLRLGESHSSTQRGKIGRYGVGFKDAVIHLGDKVEVHSLTRGGKQSSARADWQQMLKDGEWEAIFLDDSDQDEHGVTVIISDLRVDRLDEWEDVPDYIASLFSAAIDAGIFITVDEIRVESNEGPELDDLVEFRGEFEGKIFEGFCGILVDRRTAKSGWEIRWGHLTVDPSYQKEGFGNYSPQGFYGRLSLKDDINKWTLSRNKTRVQEVPALLKSEKIQAIIQPILEKLKQRGHTVQMKLNQKLAQVFCRKFLEAAKVKLTDETEETGRVRTGTKKGGKRGSALGGDGNRRRRKREQDEEAKLLEKLNRAKDIQILPHSSIEQYGIGYVDITEGGTIIKVFVEECSEFGEWIWKTPEGAPILDHYAVALLAQHFALVKEDLQLSFLSEIKLETTPLDTQRIARIWSFCIEASEFHSTGKIGIKAA
jgi:GNAT superfamily N-acetyltransferase